MAWSSREQLPLALASVGVVTVIAATAGALAVSSNPFIQYPLLAIATGAALFLVHTIAERDTITLPTVPQSPQSRKVLDVAIFLAIAATALLGGTAEGRVPDLVYPLTALVAGGTAVRIIIGNRLTVPALQVGLLALSFRATIWNAFPVYGQDTLFHLGITGYIASVGEVPMFIENYYKNYPGAHLLGATTELFTGVPTKTAFFLSVGVAHVVTLAFLYLVLVRLFDRRSVALLAVLTVGLSGGHLHLGTELYAQTLANAFLPVFLYLFLISDDLRALPLFLLFGGTVIVTHNLLPIVLVGTGVTLLACGWVVGRLVRDATGLRERLRPAPIGASLSVIAAGTLYYWWATDYLAYQTGRVKAILSIGGIVDTQNWGSTNGGTGGQSDPSSGGAPNSGSGDAGAQDLFDPASHLNPVDGIELGGVPTVSVFDVTLPNVLSWAAPYLFLGIVATIAGFLLIREVLDRRDLPNPWVVASLLLFVGFAVAFASGNLGSVNRADAAIAVLMSPLLAYVYGRMTDSRNPVGRGIVVVLVVVCVLAGTLSAPVAMSERTETSFEPLATSGEVSAVDFAQRYTTTTMADDYLDRFAHFRQLRHGKQPSNVVETLFNYRHVQESRQSYLSYLKDPRQPLLYRPHFSAFYRVDPPASLNQVYSSGNTTMHTP